jgi:hypothetical protein
MHCLPLPTAGFHPDYLNLDEDGNGDPDFTPNWFSREMEVS